MEFFAKNIIPGEVFVQLLAFLLVFFALKAMAWKPILKSLEERRSKIKNEFDSIESQKSEIEKLKAEYEAHLQRIEDEARAKLQEAVDEGRNIAREIQDKARAESQASFDKAKENIQIEIAKARLELRREIADLAIGVSERVLREKMKGDAKQEEKILEIIEEMESAT